MKPLKGIRVVELSFWMAAPSAGAILGDWGAEVIKLEEPQGDPARTIFDLGGMPSAPYNYIYDPLNRNKRNLGIDLKKPQAKEIVLRLVEKADIFLTNRRLKTIEAMGLDYDSLSRVNPKLIYVHNTGLGPRGPERNKRSFAELSWARSGIMACLGEPDSPPPLDLIGVLDMNTGVHMAAGVLLGLLVRQQSGKGVEVNTSLLACGSWTALMNIQIALGTGQDFGRVSRKAFNPVVTSYPTRDGWLYIELLNEQEWIDFCQALHKEELARDPRFNSPQRRNENTTLLISLIEETTRQRTTEEWKGQLNQYDISWEAMQTPSQVAADPQVQANDYLVDMPHPTLGAIKVVASPIQLHRTSFHPSRHAPGLGEHTKEILKEVGYSEKEIKALERERVVVQGLNQK